MIYFVRGTRSGMIKIGYSESVKRRLKALRTSSSEPLEVIAIIEGTRDDEQALHRRFAVARAQGEWFHPHRRLLEYLDELIDGKPETVADQVFRRRNAQRRAVHHRQAETIRAAAAEAGMNLHDFIHSRILGGAPSDR